MQDKSGNRLSGGLIIAATLGALVLILHHPTSLEGPDDGVLLHDWANAAVHGGMMVCLFLLRIGFSALTRRLGPNLLSVRAGAITFDGGMTAFIAAALINGFAVGGLATPGIDPVVFQPVFAGFGALNRALANLGIILTAAAMTLWGVRMLRLNGLNRATGGLGVAIGVAAACWMVAGRGEFGLYPATVSTLLFSAWSSLVASQLMRTDAQGESE